MEILGMAVSISAIFSIAVVILEIIALFLLHHFSPGWLTESGGKIKAILRYLLKRVKTKGDPLEILMENMGFAYDPDQDIFYGTPGAWQKKYGYCRLYDEAAAPSSMIIDCEPIQFEYLGKYWLIELWKGQYGMATGGEIGVFNTSDKSPIIPGILNEPFYACVDEGEELQLSFVLEKNGKKLFQRVEKHWWLTGFVLGEFSEPSELVMNADITLQDRAMRTAFLGGLMQAGYSEKDILIHGSTVSVLFSKPHMPQPATRTPATDWIIQRKNEFLCEEFQKLTAMYAGTLEKLRFIRRKSPKLLADGIPARVSSRQFEETQHILRYRASRGISEKEQ